MTKWFPHDVAAWHAAPVLATMSKRTRPAGASPPLELGEVDSVLLDVQGDAEVVLEHAAPDGTWFPLAAGAAPFYCGTGQPYNVVMTGTVRVRWSAGTFGLTLSALPPRTMIKNPDGGSP